MILRLQFFMKIRYIFCEGGMLVNKYNQDINFSIYLTEYKNKIL